MLFILMYTNMSLHLLSSNSDIGYKVCCPDHKFCSLFILFGACEKVSIHLGLEGVLQILRSQSRLIIELK